MGYLIPSAHPPRAAPRYPITNVQELCLPTRVTTNLVLGVAYILNGLTKDSHCSITTLRTAPAKITGAHGWDSTVETLTPMPRSLRGFSRSSRRSPAPSTGYPPGSERANDRMSLLKVSGMMEFSHQHLRSVLCGFPVAVGQCHTPWSIWC